MSVGGGGTGAAARGTPGPTPSSFTQYIAIVVHGKCHNQQRFVTQSQQSIDNNERRLITYNNEITTILVTTIYFLYVYSITFKNIENN